MQRAAQPPTAWTRMPYIECCRHGQPHLLHATENYFAFRPRRCSKELSTPWLLLAIYGESMQRGVLSRVDPSAAPPLRAIPPADRSVLESELMLCGVVERLQHGFGKGVTDDDYVGDTMILGEPP